MIGIKHVLIFLLAFLSSLFLFSCGNEETLKNTGYDGRVFDISAKQDNRLTLTTTKVGNYYDVEIKGSGAAISYNSKTEVPWNILAKKIKSIKINEGILNIGDYYFYSVAKDSYILPESVKEVGANSFANNAILYCYNQEISSEDFKIYHYSDSYVDDDTKFILVNSYPVVCKTYRFLFIGNSFTYYTGSISEPKVPLYFKAMAESLGLKVDVDFVVKGSHTLTKFANKEDSEGAKVEEKLTTNQYDFIILQEQSTTPINSYDAFNNAVSTLKKRINETQMDAKIYLYATWGFTAGLTSKLTTIPEMEEAITQAYDSSASANEINVTHVGLAFTYVYNNYPDIVMYNSDGRHQSTYGTYLSAYVHLNTMLKIDSYGLTFYGFESDNLDESICKRLQEVGSLITNGEN